MGWFNHHLEIHNNQLLPFVTFWSPKWRSLNPWEGHFKPPKGSLIRTLNNNSRGQEYRFSRLFALGAWLQGADQRFEGRALTIDAAPLPSDIFWENFDCPTTMRRLKTLLVSFLKASFMWYFLPDFLNICFYCFFFFRFWLFYEFLLVKRCLLLWEEGGSKIGQAAELFLGFHRWIVADWMQKTGTTLINSWESKDTPPMPPPPLEFRPV